MADLNYHHLRYFYRVATEGSLAGAADVLGVGVSTVSNQIHALEDELGIPLFTKRGRSLELTDAGRLVATHAERIFAAGDNLLEAVRAAEREDWRSRVMVGLSDDVPRHMAWRVISAMFDADAQLYPVIHQGSTDQLAGDLGIGVLDLILTTGPVASAGGHTVRSKVAATSDLILVAGEALADELRPHFPRSISGAPLLLPTTSTPTRRMLDRWLASASLRPRVMGEVADSALLKVAASSERLVVPIPGLVADEVATRYGLHPVGVVPGVELVFHITVVPGRETVLDGWFEEG